jgi:DNA-binding NarL/FixJ family response regulator
MTPIALWAGDPAGALDTVEPGLALLGGCAVEQNCGGVFALGARAAADLAETARARRDRAAERAALAAADRLQATLDAMRGQPFIDHQCLATIPGDRADWHAELSRVRGTPDPDAWDEAARIWQGHERPHRTAYALWRQAEALLARSRNPMAAADALYAAAKAATGMAPLTAAIHRLARRSRIALPPAPSVPSGPPAPPETKDPYGLTNRERHVLRLLAQGHTNAQIGTELFMSPKTAGVHVSNILRKLNVVNRAEAAAVGERAGLTDADS